MERPEEQSRHSWSWVDPHGGLKFAVVREDPATELAVCRHVGASRVLTVASGGCTALTLAAAGLSVTAFDVNPRQLEHLLAKADAVARRDLRALNVEDADPCGLNQRGAFEGLFRALHHLVDEFVAKEPFEGWFGNDRVGAPTPGTLSVEAAFASRYWPAAFASVFGDALLHALFGTEATRHADPGSYPAYFRRVFERGLTAAEAARNPFLQHVFLGCYRERDAPPYVTAGRLLTVALVRGGLLEVPDLERYQLYSLSNVFDWSDDVLVRDWANALKRAAPSGSAVLVRQLNNRRDLRAFFEPEFAFDDALGSALLLADRSLFYERIEVCVRR